MRDGPDRERRLFLRVEVLLRRHWRDLLRLREKLRFSEEAVHLLLAGGVGVIGGLVNVSFRFCNDQLRQRLMGYGGDWVEIAKELEGWQLMLAPAAGGLIAGLILFWGLRIVGLPGSSNLLEVVVVGDGRLGIRTAFVKALSSLVSISTGGSIGREGSITQLSATLASKWGQMASWQPYRLRLLVACGAAAGMAAAYNAPVAGSVFAAQIVLGSFSMRLFAPLVFASVVATIVSRTFFGVAPTYEIPMTVEFDDTMQLPWFLLLGGLTGAAGATFLKLIHSTEKLFDRLRQPLFVRMAVGGLLVGAIATGYPQVFGNGYDPTSDILHQRYALQLLLGVFVAKLLATLLTVGSGAVGGVFTPTLFLGAGLGGLLAQVLQWTGWSEGANVTAFALVGMGSMLAATTHSPLLAMIMVFEISLAPSLMPPLMVACVVATLVARSFYRDSIYTEPLRRRGISLERESSRPGSASQTTVGDLMRRPVTPVKQTALFREIADRFLTSSNNYLPVVDNRERFVGVVALQDLKQYLTAGPELNSVIAFDVMRPIPPCLTPDQSLFDAMTVLLASDMRNVPVVNTPIERRLVGAVVRAEALGVLSEAIASRGEA